MAPLRRRVVDIPILIGSHRDQRSIGPLPPNPSTSIFKGSQITDLVRDEDHEQGRDGSLVAGSCELAGREFLAANGGQPFRFTPAISFFLDCRTEQEQIVPAIVRTIVQSGDQQKAKQVLRAMMQMKKPDIRRLEDACCR